MTQLTIFDEPADLDDLVAPPNPDSVSTVYNNVNRRVGHLRINDDKGGTICFVNYGRFVALGPSAGPNINLTADQLRTVGDYCHRAAGRLDASNEYRASGVVA